MLEQRAGDTVVAELDASPLELDTVVVRSAIPIVAELEVTVVEAESVAVVPCSNDVILSDVDTTSVTETVLPTPVIHSPPPPSTFSQIHAIPINPSGVTQVPSTSPLWLIQRPRLVRSTQHETLLISLNIKRRPRTSLAPRPLIQHERFKLAGRNFRRAAVLKA
ncbi:uncharacterized protein BCR38DRAFT_81697 [Pseudomassariella vexata]|uniref:Uncharacterized protein n=1 Tax=Pseudomassariella vexata TaxID=1141098 RepID=A0A1Y2DF46_9PEZI|nr:uncharacterized protein BCR38DRAFT_81697 [Pseudomassariella vexata]ORY57879.1 hypothetical protein BCR38DRAFT_81697 [Pseudomassariella vexata]